jgi:hypothetical protein
LPRSERFSSAHASSHSTKGSPSPLSWLPFHVTISDGIANGEFTIDDRIAEAESAEKPPLPSPPPLELREPPKKPNQACP